METLSNRHASQPPAAAPFVLAPADAMDQESGFDFWGVLNRRKWLVFLGLITGMGLGGLYHAQTDTIYESRANIKIEPKNPLVMNFTSNNPMLPSADHLDYRHDRFITQPNIIDKCLETYNLYNLESFDEIARDKVSKKIRGDLEVVPDKEESFIYEMTYRTKDRYDTKTVLNNLIETYRASLELQYQDDAEEYHTLLKDVQKTFDNEYTILQEQIDTKLKEHTSPPITQSGMNIHQFKMATLTTQIESNESKFNSFNANRERVLEAIQGGIEKIEDMVWILRQNGHLEFHDQRIVADRNTQNQLVLARDLSRMKMQLSERSQRLGAAHPQIKALQTQIKFWESYMENTAQEESQLPGIGMDPEETLHRYLISIDQRLEDLRTSLQADRLEFVRHQQEAERLGNIKRQIDTLSHRSQFVEDLLKSTNRKILEINADGDLSRGKHEGFYFDVLMAAAPGDEVWPILPVVLGIGGLLGTLLGFGLGCLVELADKTFHNPDEIMKQLNLPLIGHIPVISSSKRYLVEDSLIEPIVCTYHRPKSQVAEAFRAVRTALYFNTQGHTHQVIQVTSPTPGDGKSTLAANLAVSIAQSGKRVLLVDADMRRPRQNVTFNITSTEGFATVLSGQSIWRDVVYDCEEIDGLSIMPCGAKPNNPAELSTSPQVKELIEEMREEFDFVLIDTPPLLAVTDPCPIAARVDGVIVTLRIKKNVRVSAERATDILRNLGASVVGLVVNGVGAQTGYGSQYTYGAYRSGYAYNGYGYGYGYGYGAGNGANKYYDEDQKGRRHVPKNIEAQPAVDSHPVE